LSSRSVAYQVLNITGSVGLVIKTGWNGAIPSAAVNVIWLGIGAHALWPMRARPKRRNGRREDSPDVMRMLV
jgi:hypothetical protein